MFQQAELRWYLLRDDSPVGIGFANVTFGDERKNISISSGLGFSDAGDNITLLNVSAMIEVSSSLWIITENYQIFQTSSYSGNPDNLTIISMGIRRASQKRDILWDYAWVAIPSEEDLFSLAELYNTILTNALSKYGS